MSITIPDGSNVGIDIDIIDRNLDTEGRRLIFGSLSRISQPVEDISFGQSVASKPYGRNDITVLTGAPGSAAAFVHSFQQSSTKHKLTAKMPVIRR